MLHDFLPDHDFSLGWTHQHWTLMSKSNVLPSLCQSWEKPWGKWYCRYTLNSYRQMGSGSTMLASRRVRLTKSIKRWPGNCRYKSKEHLLNDYKYFKSCYLTSNLLLQNVDLKDSNENQRLAFFVNVYNALVIHGFVERGSQPANHLERLQSISLPLFKTIFKISF